jgi:hypothetical protein
MNSAASQSDRIAWSEHGGSRRFAGLGHCAAALLLEEHPKSKPHGCLSSGAFSALSENRSCK